MRTKTVAVILLGIFAWIVAAVIGLLMNADTKFIWTCLVGIALGLIGIRYSIRRDRRSGL
jgi:1,4-dihydroxy-2-naphthoate octaprenyltransferase